MPAPTDERGTELTMGTIIEVLGLERFTPELPEDLSRPIVSAYATDLLSDVLAHAPRGSLLVTVQAHLNVIAVAVHAELGGVIFALGRRPENAVLRRAVEQGIAAYGSTDTVFNIAGRLYALGLRGDAE